MASCIHVTYRESLYNPVQFNSLSKFSTKAIRRRCNLPESAIFIIVIVHRRLAQIPTQRLLILVANTANYTSDMSYSIA